MNKALVALAAVFLAAHLPLLPPTLEDLDSINFALGVRDFDVARHQPHPPGYPLFIGAGKVSTAVMRAAGVPAPEARGLAVWSTLGGAVLVFLVFALFRALEAPERQAWWATVIAVTSPLFWFTALRPLSDTWGLAMAVAAQAPLMAAAAGRAGASALLWGAFIAGLAMGFRSQTFVLTLPLLALALVRGLPGFAVASGVPRFRAAHGVAALAALSAGVLAWGVPLIVASGGLTSYAVALGAQAGEDFSGVEMLFRAPGARVLASALVHTFVWPWGSVAAGAVVCTLAAAGLAQGAWQVRRPVILLFVAFGPYAVFHLVFQEVQTVRYALPLVVPVAYLAAAGLAAAGPRVLPVGALAIAGASLIFTVPATLVYGGQASPPFRLLDDVRGIPAGRTPDARRPKVDFAFHAVFRRTVEWDREGLPARLLKAPHGREWLTLVSAWRRNPGRRIAVAANPVRTDLALFDPQARRRMATYGWGFPEKPFVGGARPGAAELHLLDPPGWMLDRGWALTPEIGGVTARDRLGPHIRPSVAWVRVRAIGATIMLGGRHLGAGGEPPVRITVLLAGRPVDVFEAAAGPFFRLIELPEGALRNVRPYVPLEVASVAADGSAQIVPVGLEQFDLQPEGVVMTGLREGWHEPEFNAATGRAWRWMSPRAAVWVRPVGRDVTLTLAGESPLRYFDRAPEVRVSVAGREVARFQPSGDFTESIVLPAAQLSSADGRVVVESDLSFVPADRAAAPDRRSLALRIFEVRGQAP